MLKEPLICFHKISACDRQTDDGKTERQIDEIALSVNRHDGIVLQTEMGDQCDKLAVDRLRYCQLS